MTRTCIDRRLSDGAVLAAVRSPSAERRSAIAVDAPIERLRMALLKERAWKPGRELSVCFLDGDPTVQSRVRDIAKEWERHAFVRFDFDDDPEAEIRISFTPGGSWSWVGTEALERPVDEPTMNLGWLRPDDPDEEYARVTLHEFGHVLGCVHEHQSPAAGVPWNLEAVYDYYSGPPNLWSEEEVRANLVQVYEREQTAFTEFDPASIMVYPIPKEHTTGGFEVGWNSALSTQDREFIGKRYPFPLAGVPSIEIGADPVEGRISATDGEDAYHVTVTEPGEHVIETTGFTYLALVLYGPDDDDHLLEQDDANSGLGGNAMLAVGLEAGRYLVRVRRTNAGGDGRYALAVSRRAAG